MFKHKCISLEARKGALLKKLKKEQSHYFDQRPKALIRPSIVKARYPFLSDLSLKLISDAVNERVTRVIDPKYDIGKVTFNIDL